MRETTQRVVWRATAAGVVACAASFVMPNAGAVVEPEPSLPPSGSYIPAETPATLHGCSIFPTDSLFHADVRNAPVDANSASILAAWDTTAPNSSTVDAKPSIPTQMSIEGQRFGIPYNVATSATALRNVWNVLPSPPIKDTNIPVPAPFSLQETGDKHGLILQKDSCKLYEYLNVRYWGVYIGPNLYGWVADNGGNWDLSSYNYFYRGTKPTSSTGTRLPLLPTLLKIDEVKSGEIDHPLRFSIRNTKLTDYRWPAAGSDGKSVDAGALPEGLWLRVPDGFESLPGFDGLSDEAETIVRTLAVHGMYLDDTGGNYDRFTITAEKSTRWENETQSDLGGTLRDALTEVEDFLEGPASERWEVIDLSGMNVSPTSFQIN